MRGFGSTFFIPKRSSWTFLNELSVVRKLSLHQTIRGFNSCRLHLTLTVAEQPCESGLQAVFIFARRLAMNKHQLITLWVGLGIVLVMVLFPPWKYVYSGVLQVTVEKQAPYAPIFAPPEIMRTPKGMWTAKIDFSRLVVQAVVVLLVTGGLVFIFGRLFANRGR